LGSTNLALVLPDGTLPEAGQGERLIWLIRRRSLVTRKGAEGEEDLPT
jgi:hypothetical protein